MDPNSVEPLDVNEPEQFAEWMKANMPAFWKWISMPPADRPEPKEIKIPKEVAENGIKFPDDLPKLLGVKTLIDGKQIVDHLLPTDKVNRGVTKATPSAGNPDTLTYYVDTKAEKSKSRRDVGIALVLNFSELGVTIPRNIDFQDMLVYGGVYDLWSAGARVMSLSDIHFAMGNRSNMNSKQKEKILASLSKFRAVATIDNSEELKAHYHYPISGIFGEPMLMYSFQTVIVDGNQTTGIEIAKEPCLMRFARARKNLARIPSEVLESPLNKNNGNLQIMEYLNWRIARAKDGKTEPRILEETIFSECGITTWNQRDRAPEKIRTHLEHCVSIGWIAGYTVETNNKGEICYDIDTRQRGLESCPES